MATPLLKHTWQTIIKNDSGASVVTDSQSILGSSEFNEKITIPAGTTAEMDCGTLPVVKMVSLFLSSNQPVVVATNALDFAGGQEIDLAANKVFAWNNLQPTPNPITSDITKFFVTNPGTQDATFRAAFLMQQLI